MEEYSTEYKEELKAEFMELSNLRQKVLDAAGDGPYNAEEQLILSDYEEVLAEYEEVFNGNSLVLKKMPASINKIFKKVCNKFKNRELPAYKREPIYCDNATVTKRQLNVKDYELIKLLK